VNDLRKANKAIKKAKDEISKVNYTRVGDFKDLKVITITDGSYLKLEEKTKSVMGRFVFLSGADGKIVNCIGWKGKTIPTVCKSPKASETRAAEKAVEDAIFVARTLCELYRGKRGEDQIPVIIYTDSQALLDSMNSTRQIENKLLRPIIKWFKQCLDSKMVKEVKWCDTEVCLADILTKSGSKLTEKALDLLRNNEMVDLTFSREKNKEKDMELLKRGDQGTM